MDPVNALDNAIRKNVNKLAKYSEYLKDLKLVDYKVRILNTGTEAVTRVSIESTDSKHGKNWFTIGVSPNIIDASFKALVDSLIINYLKIMLQQVLNVILKIFLSFYTNLNLSENIGACARAIKKF